uniref:Uncharacterized protein n=1 Tax=Salix viminalis TaxID=40686 RepID=A0A6N2LT14_SALVM
MDAGPTSVDDRAGNLRLKAILHGSETPDSRWTQAKCTSKNIFSSASGILSSGLETSVQFQKRVSKSQKRMVTRPSARVVELPLIPHR